MPVFPLYGTVERDTIESDIRAQALYTDPDATPIRVLVKNLVSDPDTSPESYEFWDGVVGAGDIIPPVVVAPTYGGLYKVVDGHHRVSVAADRGLETVDAWVVSEDLAKTQSISGFPHLGVTNDHQFATISTQRQQDIVHLGAVSQTLAGVKNIGLKEDPQAIRSSLSLVSPRIKGGTLGVHRYKEAGVKRPYGWIKDRDPGDSDPEASKAHESFHAMMANVGTKHTPVGINRLCANLWSTIPTTDTHAYPELRGVAHSTADVVNRVLPALYKNGNVPHDIEEHIAYLHNYLNSPQQRETVFNYLRSSGINWGENRDWDAIKRDVDRGVKTAFRHIQHAASVADESWTKKLLPSVQQHPHLIEHSRKFGYND